MAAMATTSLRVPDDLRERYDALAKLTGRSRNELIVQAMERFIDNRMREVALIQEGLDQIDRGDTFTLDEVVADFAARGLLDLDAFQRDREWQATT